MPKSFHLLFILATAVAGAADTPTADSRETPVVTTATRPRLFQERVTVQGDVEARQKAMVPARIPGTLVTLFVDEGHHVTAGETPLFQTDDVKLKTALELSQLELAVSQCSLLEKEANRERELAELERAEKDFIRRQNLFTKEAIGTANEVEEAEADYKKALASVKHARSLIALAKAQMNQAAARVDMARKDLSDTKVIAPISGAVTRRFQDTGEMGSPAQPVFSIESTKDLEVSCFIPAQYYSRVVEGDTVIKVSLDSQELGEFPVSYRSPTIDSQLRVFEVKCRIGDGGGKTAPGAMVGATVVLDRRQATGVPKKALVTRGGEQFIFTVEQGKAIAKAVTTGIENDGWVALTGGDVGEGVPVITEGQFMLNNGSPVDVRAAN
ncbi:MAG: efflux RND transporter periplasmic adaptor subunit [Lentisphaeria bacterium]|nr:efflux RND transporter periplasmic adaptor subunit [Lentisphaeria bacterium]